MTTSAPTLSIIVPVYKAEKFIDRCVKSILDQTFTDWELIMVDDGSPDRSGEICDQYASIDPRIKVLHTNNGGQSRARNLAFKQSTGKYITYVDSDDYLIDKGSFETAIMAIESSPDIDVVQFQYDEINDIKSEATHFNYDNQKYFGAKKCLEEFSLVKMGSIYGAPWAKIYKRAQIEEIPFPEGMVYEDSYFLTDLFFISQGIMLINKGRYGYIFNPHSTVGKELTRKQALDMCRSHIHTYLRMIEAECSLSSRCHLIAHILFDMFCANQFFTTNIYPDEIFRVIDRNFPERIIGTRRDKIILNLTKRLNSKRALALLVFGMRLKRLLTGHKLQIATKDNV